jgi:hypothetical protein
MLEPGGGSAIKNILCHTVTTAALPVTKHPILFLLKGRQQAMTKPSFSPFSPDFPGEILEKNSVLFPISRPGGTAG